MDEDTRSKIEQVKTALKKKNWTLNGPGPDAPPREQLDWFLPEVRKRLGLGRAETIQATVEFVAETLPGTRRGKVSELVRYVAKIVLAKPPWRDEAVMVTKAELLATVHAYNQYTNSWRGWWRGRKDRKRWAYSMPLAMTLIVEYAEKDEIHFHVADLEDLLVPKSAQKQKQPPPPEHPYR